jgi:uncharacterized protein (DUF433 family)
MRVFLIAPMLADLVVRSTAVRPARSTLPIDAASSRYHIQGMSKSRRPRKRKTSPLLIDTLAPSLFERSAAYLRRGLPPDATEFDRVCFQAMANFVWLHCPDVESVPDRCSGQWVVKGTRVIVQTCILDNAEDFTAEQIADVFEVPVDAVKRILAFARPT